ncbi:MAG TPA: aminotransferase class I/II-fold pyridoxal phosphate-dependent enzyme [Natronosporangium sp.]
MSFDDLTPADLRRRGSLKWTKFGGDTIGAFVAEMDFGTAPPIVAALHRAIDTISFGYLPPQLQQQLAQACAGWLRRRYGWAVGPEQIYPVTDVLTAFELVMLHYSRPGSPIILPTPAYMPLLRVPPMHGRRVIQVPMRHEDGRYRLDLAGIDRAFRAGGDLLVLCNPVNPVGRVYTAAELAEVTEVVERHGGVVFADEVHAPLVYPGHQHIPYASTSPAAAAHTITATAASKAWDLPGLKCAQVILSNPAHEECWLRVAVEDPAAPSNLGVVAAIAAYESGEPWLDQVLGYLDGNRRAVADLLAEHAPAIGYTPPEGTYLAWLDCRKLELSGPLGELVRERAGVAVVDGAECGEAGRGFLRLNFATPRPVLREAITRLGSL